MILSKYRVRLGVMALPCGWVGTVHVALLLLKESSQQLVDDLEPFLLEPALVKIFWPLGGRTLHRMCLDHPERVIKACIMDVLPNYHVWTNTTKGWAIASWHWLFMAQPEPFPERLMSAAGAEFFLRNRMAIRGGTGLDF